MDNTQLEQMLAKYADVVVKVGLNIQPGQMLSIRAQLEDGPFIREVTRSAYKAGARYVDVLWGDEQLNRIRHEHAEEDSLSHIPEWLLPRYEEYYKTGSAELAILAPDPNLYEGIDPERVARSRKALYQKVVEPLRKYENESNWCVVATATSNWAKKVHPGLPVSEAQARLWDAIFKSCRIDQPDPVKAWENHIGKLNRYKDYLNAKSYTGLHYKGPGTDLILGLPELHLWSGAEESFKNGVTCTVNIPTEEVFTLPHKDKADGVVTATRPLNAGGTLIENFSLTFENGRVTKIVAQKGEENLRKLIETDENGGRLGEVALVPNSSPISQSGILFYNTLFDENASCHIAFGNAYRTTMRGGDEMTGEEFMAYGGNQSMIHVDFMIGSDKLDIDGILADGSHEPLMRSGEWAIQI